MQIISYKLLKFSDKHRGKEKLQEQMLTLKVSICKHTHRWSVEGDENQQSEILNRHNNLFK